MATTPPFNCPTPLALLSDRKYRERRGCRGPEGRRVETNEDRNLADENDIDIG